MMYINGDILAINDYSIKHTIWDKKIFDFFVEIAL